MSVDQNLALVRRYNDGVWNEGRLELLRELCLPEYIIHLARPPFAVPLDLYGEAVVAWWAAFPDCFWTVEDKIAEHDKVAVRLLGRGTHTGPYGHPLFGMIPPTGRAVTVSETNIYRIVEGKLAECWPELDWLGLFQQLGVLSSRPHR